ncbi:hypothetical protein ZOSMA_64G00430 [Zostera marina]|uniref:Protein kinase domain-containing protein n=1 Tax=Zostera marina TaxID=29655 RepID=A0A0K9NT65_ZOSMR|nr:hypothetical protein ZOSMA_64G00430 [Zostera marina]
MSSRLQFRNSSRVPQKCPSQNVEDSTFPPTHQTAALTVPPQHVRIEVPATSPNMAMAVTPTSVPLPTVPITKPQGESRRIQLARQQEEKISIVGLGLTSVLNRKTGDLNVVYCLGRKLGRGQFGVSHLCVEKATVRNLPASQLRNGN